MGIPSDGSYGIPKDVMYGFPVTCENGKYEIVQGLAVDDYSRTMMDKTLAELEEERAGVTITYVTEAEPLGTAGAIRFAADSLGDRLEDRFLALNGDVLADLDLSALLRAHAERGAAATIALHPVADSSFYGLVNCDEEGAVLAGQLAAPNESTGRLDDGLDMREEGPG